MSLVHSPTIPVAALWRIAAVIALAGAAALAWFAVVEPAIEDAAADQVDSIVAELDTSSPGDGGPDTATPSTTPTEGDVTQTAGTSTFIRLAVDAPLTQTADQSTTLADGAVFDMTDIRVENPYNDRGVATLLVNSEPMFIWSLENIRGSFFEPRITPIRLNPGDNLTFSVRCDEIGDTSRSTCTNALNIVGVSVDDQPG
jgi:hypothetical protein